jgi:4-amino-4-deoxy-L-arabinose transferase-like glycosyltransferase
MPRAQPKAAPNAKVAWWLHHAWILPVLLVAAWLRFAHLGGRFLYGDEAEYAIVARYLSRDWLYLAYPAIEGMGAQPFVSQPPLILYMMAVSMKIFGATDFAAMFPSLVLGIGTVAVAYAIGHRLGGRFMGLSAAAILAVLPFHIEMSRRAMLDSGYAFFLALTAYFMIAWWEDRKLRQAIGVGGAAAGAALAKLPGALAGPVVLLFFLFALGVALLTRQRVKETLAHGAAGAAPIALGALLYLGLLNHLSATQNLWLKLQWQLGRVDSGASQIAEVSAKPRETTWYFTDPSFSFQHLLGPVVFGVAIVGLLVALLLFARRPHREGKHLVVPLFVIVLLSFFMYSERKEGFYLLPFAPFAAISVAYAAEGLRRMLAWAGIRFSRVASRAAPLAVALALVVVAVPAYASVAKSYDRYVLDGSEEQYFGSGTREAAYWIRDHDPEAAQYGTLLGRFTLHWYNEQPAFHWYVAHDLIESKIQKGELKYIVYDDYLGLQFDRQYMQQIIDKYNGQMVASFGEGWGEDGVKVFELHP